MVNIELRTIDKIRVSSSKGLGVHHQLAKHAYHYLW